MKVAARLATLLGAEPEYFFPFLRAYSLIVRRRSRMRLARGISAVKAVGGIPPFYISCAVSVLIGFGGVAVAMQTGPSLLGTVAALTLGTFLVMLSVLFDYLDVFASPEEYRAIAAHPHHAGSILLAKMFVVGRAVVTLGACYFAPVIVAVGILHHSVAAAAAFAAGAALAVMVVALAVMRIGVGILMRWGNALLRRVLPVMQSLLLVGYMATIWGKRSIGVFLPASGSGMPGWVTFLPTAWFVAPLEWTTGVADGGTWVRGALGVVFVAAVAAFGTRWTRAGFSEAILRAGEVRPRAGRAAAGRAGGAGEGAGGASGRAGRASGRRTFLPPWLARDPGVRTLLSMAGIHLRGDMAFRGQLIVSTIMPMAIFLSPALSPSARRQAGPELALLLGTAAIAMALVSLTAVSTTSSRTEALWAVLVAPLDRVRYTLSVRKVLRTFVVAPAVIVAGVWYLAPAGGAAAGWGVAGGITLFERCIRVAGIAVYLDLLVTAQRGLMPEFPFSMRPNRDRRASWWQVLSMFMGFGIGAGGGLGLFLLWQIRGWGSWAALGVMLLWRVVAEPFTRWRVRRTVAAMEMI